MAALVLRTKGTGIGSALQGARPESWQKAAEEDQKKRDEADQEAGQAKAEQEGQNLDAVRKAEETIPALDEDERPPLRPQ